MLHQVLRGVPGGRRGGAGEDKRGPTCSTPERWTSNGGHSGTWRVRTTTTSCSSQRTAPAVWWMGRGSRGGGPVSPTPRNIDEWSAPVGPRGQGRATPVARGGKPCHGQVHVLHGHAAPQRCWSRLAAWPGVTGTRTLAAAVGGGLW